MTQRDPILLNDWHVVCKSKDIQPANIKPVKLLGQDIVLWRGNSPESPVVAWQDRCPHRSVALSFGKIVGDRLACKYHGWQYDRNGQCVKIPSLSTQPSSVSACVKTYKCQESQGYIWVSLGNPVQDIPSFPEWENKDYRLLILNPYFIKTSPFRVMENNIDLSHVAFLHEGSLGDSDYPTIENYEVTSDKDCVTIHNLKSWQLDGSYQGDKIINRIITSVKIDRPLSCKVVKEIKNSSNIIYWFVNK